MAHLIDKDALMEEIERMRDQAFPNSDWNHEYVNACESIISFLNTLEVKEVVAEQEGKCNAILNTITGDTTWHIKIPLDKAGLKHGDKVKIFIAKGE